MLLVRERIMTNNKLLVVVNDKSIITDLRGTGVNLVFPLKSFSVGFTNYFDIDEIGEDDFIFINRILDSDDYDRLKEILDKKHKFKGIIFDDLGVLEIIKDYNNVEKILFMNHLLASYRSINIMLEYVDSVFISTDITKEEIDEIIDKCNKKLVIYGFGYVNIMYSRRNLITNYRKHHELEIDNELVINETNKDLITIESDLGTVIYDSPCLYNPYYNDSELIKYIFVNTVFLDKDEIMYYINNLKPSDKTKYYDGFLNKKTIYKLKDGDE